MTMQGKVALVTGGGRGIGAATARLLAAQGASVVVNYLKNASTAEQVVEQIRTNEGQAIAVQADVRDLQQAERLAEAVLTTYGRIDILVHSVSASAVIKPFAEMNWEEFALGITSELKAAFGSTKAVLPAMQHQRYGRIVYLASGLAKAPTMHGAISIGTAKAGLVAFAKYIAKEFGSYGITANTVAPSMVETDLSVIVPPEQKQRIATLTPLGRIAQPEDIAQVVAFFASDASGFMTGTYAPVNGGITME